MTSQLRNTGVSLKGLLDVLGENLYSTPIVSIRELVQNAHDACVRRRTEAHWDEKPRIHIETDSAHSRITISDNGSGLTENEIITYLATIGDGYTRKMRKTEQNQVAIGYFGLGFLSVFVVAHKVEFFTCSYQSPNKAWCYSSKDGQRYTIKASKVRAVGSSVVLQLKDDYSVISDEDFISTIIKKYCCLLDIDIFINHADTPTNRIEIPWKLARNSPAVRHKKSAIRFAGLFDPDFDPIATIPIKAGDDRAINGLIWIQDGSYYANADNRMTTIFIRSMHITDDCKDLLPPWAGFIGCVIDTPLLMPTASRETVQKNETFELVQQHIKNTLIDGLAHIARENGAAWRRMMAQHNDNLRGATVSDETLFDAMHQQLTLPTSEGELMVSEILNRSHSMQSAQLTKQDTLYLNMSTQNSHETLIFKSLGIPVIHGFRYAVGLFCKRLKQTNNINTLVMGTKDSNEDIFPEYALDDKTKEKLTKYFGDSHTKTIISAFKPDCLPVILMQDEDAQLKKRIESDKLDKQINSAALMMARQFTKTMDIDCDQYQFINYNNSLIKNFHSFDKDKQTAISTVIKNIAALLSASDTTENIKLFESLNEHLEKLVTL